MKYIVLFMPLISVCVEPTDIQIHHTHDSYTISMHDSRDLPAILYPTEEITITMPADRQSEIESPPLSRKERMRKACSENKTALIACVTTVSSAAIAGIVTLIVHFTAS